MSTTLALVAAKALPALSGSSLTYNPEKNMFLTPGYTSAAGYTYYKAIRLSDRLAVYYHIGEGYAHTFLNGITLFAWNGQKANIIAQKFLGECYTFGKGVEQSLEEAAEWYLKAAMRGALEAQVNLGICYSQGMGVEQDYAEAVKWFKEAAEAYAVLSDADKRRQYDQFGHAAFEGGMGGGAGGFDFSGADFGDIFGDLFGDLFGGGRSRAQHNGPMKGANLRTSIRISFEEAVFGCEKEFELDFIENCSKCDGAGGLGEKTCPTCHGAGQVRQGNGFFTIQQTCPTCRGNAKPRR